MRKNLTMLVTGAQFVRNPEKSKTPAGRRNGRQAVWRWNVKFLTVSILAITASVTVLALAFPAEAEIVYTPVNIVFTNGSYNLDVNNDGVTDFVIKATNKASSCRTPNVSASLWVYLASGTGVEGARDSATLDAGSLIGPDQMFRSTGRSLIEDVSYGRFGVCGMTRCECETEDGERGNWLNESAYLGLEFQVDEETHYGWAQMTVKFDPSRLLFSATLTGYAYETIPGVPIRAGRKD